MPLTDVRLSVLDISPIVQGSSAAEALHNTVDLARLADRLGYHRYWVPEHHGMRGVASAAPAVLIGRIAAATSRIRVGAGGVLLPNHPPLAVAEQFGTLEALHPGRIDLGLGRAPGGPQTATDLLRADADRSTDGLADQVRELTRLFAPSDMAAAPVAVPAAGNGPPMWLLGTSDASARLAADLGLPYAFAHHLSPDRAAEAARAYRQAFRPSASLRRPQTLISVSIVIAEDDERAAWLASSHRIKLASRRAGRPILLPPPGTGPAEAGSTSPADARRVLTGSATTVVAELDELVSATGADEVMLRTDVYEHQERRRSYELLREHIDRAATLPPG